MANQKKKKKESNPQKPEYSGFTFWWKLKDTGEEKLIQWPPPEILEKRLKIFRKIHRRNKIMKVVIIIILAWAITYGFSAYLKEIL